jgi:hypothetical protein
MTVPDVSGSSLPPLYERWIEELLQASPPVETRSTCHHCPMISEQPERNASEHRFHPQTKCCTYWPEIPNFLAGFILQENDAEFEKARAQTELFLTREMTVTPLGASPPAAFLARYNQLKLFGTDPGLRCPFYREDWTFFPIFKITRASKPSNKSNAKKASVWNVNTFVFLWISVY